MSKQGGVSMRTRRLITFSVLGALAASSIGVFGLPKNSSPELNTSPDVTQNIADQVQARPATIFDPPKYSIDQADSIWVVVNKQRPLSPLRYRPSSLSFPNFPNPTTQNPYGLKLRTEAALAAESLAAAMLLANEGTLILNSGFRTFKTQRALYQRTKAARGLKVAEKLSARPGHSEHQLGLAADFSIQGQGCSIMVCFGKSSGGKWLAANAHEFGFIIRYPKGFRSITGFQYEPWHFRFVGVELASEMKAKGIKTLEQFWGLDPAPNYPNPAG